MTQETITGEETIEAPPPEFDIIKHQNGCETIIHYKLKSVDEEKDFEDEPLRITSYKLTGRVFPIVARTLLSKF